MGNQSAAIARLHRWAIAHGLEALFRKIEGDRAVEMSDRADVLDERWFSFFHHYRFESIPEEIGLLTRLERFDVRGNGLKALPEAIGAFSRLESLAVMDNCIEQLPESVGRCTRLTYLDLRNNRLKSLPESIGNLRRLRMLNVSGNPLQALPETLRNCTALERLDISGTAITSLPAWLSRMPGLKRVITLLPFKTRFERTLESGSYGAMKATFYRIFEEELTDEVIAQKQRFMIGDEGWPLGWAIWGEDARGEHIEYYLTSRFGDTHGKIYRDGEHDASLPALWQVGPIDDRYRALEADLQNRGLL